MPKMVDTAWGAFPMQGPKSYNYYLSNYELRGIKLLPNCKWLEPNPRITNQKSFYHRAYVERSTGYAILYSYETPVAALVNGEMVRLWDDWSATTAKHVQSFWGCRISKREWLEMPVQDLRYVYDQANC